MSKYHSVRLLVSALLAASLAACSGATDAGKKAEDVEDAPVAEQTSITRETAEEVAGRTRDVHVVAEDDEVLVSYEACVRTLKEAGFDDVKPLVVGCDGKEDGKAAESGDTAREMVGWWLDEAGRAWVIHCVSGDVFATRLWLEDADETQMLVCTKERVTMWDSEMGHMVRIGTSELEREGVQVEHVDTLNAKSLSGVERGGAA